MPWESPQPTWTNTANYTTRLTPSPPPNTTFQAFDVAPHSVWMVYKAFQIPSIQNRSELMPSSCWLKVPVATANSRGNHLFHQLWPTSKSALLNPPPSLEMSYPASTIFFYLQQFAVLKDIHSLHYEPPLFATQGLLRWSDGPHEWSSHSTISLLLSPVTHSFI